MIYIVLANIVVALHVAYVAFVVLGQLVILIGWPLRWEWVRNPWFRVLHLAAMIIVAAETVIGMRCPLTTWENQLRELGGQQAHDVDFIGKMLQSLIFVDLPDGHWLLTLGYFAFTALVILSWILIPPRMGRTATSK